MDTEKVLEVVASALDLEPSERRAFLDRACSDSADLRAEVESLLGQQERVGLAANLPVSRDLPGVVNCVAFT